MDNGIVLIEREMILADHFESEFRGNKYNIYRFVEPETLSIYTATNIEGEFEIGETYTCQVGFKRNKLVVLSAE